MSELLQYTYIKLLYYKYLLLKFYFCFTRHDVKNKRKNCDNDENNSVISTEKKKRFKSHDTKEGLTVFFKNVSFSVNNDELKQFMKKHFGPIYYALVCVDRLTEHSKGTAFVKFRVNFYILIKKF